MNTPILTIAELVEDVEFLAERGVGMDEVARRVGMTPAALERRLYRNGRGDLSRWLVRNQNGDL